jgi:hypothetical protein
MKVKVELDIWLPKNYAKYLEILASNSTIAYGTKIIYKNKKHMSP